MKKLVIKSSDILIMPIVVGTIVLGSTSPLLSYYFIYLSRIEPPQELLQIVLLHVFAVIWPAAWIFAMLAGALVPLFGKTELLCENGVLTIRKRLFGICWQRHKEPAAESLNFSIVQRTEQSPTHSSANQIGQGTTATCFFELLASRKGKSILVQDSYERTKLEDTLKDIQQLLFNANF